jgi:hypothetical protein
VDEQKQHRCDTCRFWERLPRGHQDTEELDEQGGTCRRFPPLMDITMLMGLDRVEAKELVWKAEGYIFPVSWADNWCGEWQAKGE